MTLFSFSLISSAGEAWQAVPVVSFSFPVLGGIFWTNPWALSVAVVVLILCLNHNTNHDFAQAGSSAVSSLRLAISNFWNTQVLERVHMKWRPHFKRGNSFHASYSNRLPAAWVSQGENSRKTTAIWVTSIFFVLLGSNAFGLVPLFSAVTGQAGTTLGLSFAVWIAVTLSAMIRLRSRFVKLFLPGGIGPAMVPVFVLLESISYSFRAISLGVRLFANMVSGHQLLHLFTAMTLAPALCCSPLLGFPVTVGAAFVLMALSGLEAVVCVLQSGVFCLLTAYYLNEGLSKQDPLARPSRNLKITFSLAK